MKTTVNLPMKASNADIVQSMIASFRIENITISEDYAAISMAKAEEKLRKLKK